VEKRKSLSLARNRTPAVQPADPRYTDRNIPAHKLSLFQSVNATNEKYQPEMLFSSAVNIFVVNRANEIKHFLPVF
jgi:hypothetical protein